MAGDASSEAAGLRVLLVLGHPRAGSLCHALGLRLRDGALAAGAQVRVLDLAGIDFDPDVRMASPEDQPLEPVLRQAQRDILWAQHLVLVHPTWWGTFPARLKALLDRVLVPGFAFRHRPDGTWDKLLAGRTAELVTTMDTPHWVYRWLHGAPGRQALAASTLGYCGVRTVRATVFGPVVDSTPSQRSNWLDRAHTLGARLRDGPRSAAQRATDRVAAWLRALRLQFYPMGWAAYSVGALAAAGSRPLDWPAWWLGLAALFLLEVATVFCNEWFDRDSDRLNRNAGPFNGGSRVLVDGSLRPAQMRVGIGLALAGFAVLMARMPHALAGGACAAGVGMAISAGATWPALAAFAALTVLALGYTVPPLKLSHRGWGELDVALTHSAGVMLPGWLLQGGAIGSAVPWLLGLPLFFAVLPAIVLSGVPDHDADRAAGKRTLVVKLGVPASLRLAQASVLLAAALGVGWWVAGVAGSAYGWAIVGTVPHAVWLVAGLASLRRQARPPGRIDAMMVRALTFIVWFALVPLLRLA